MLAPVHAYEHAIDATGFGKYRLVASLGKGGMADVFLAVVIGPAGFSKLQVLKRIRSELIDEPEFLAMFLDEARLSARLNHPNVVQTNEVGDVGGHYFIAMEYLDGQPLNLVMQRAFRETGALSQAMMLKIVSDALAGLHYAHELTDYDGAPLCVVHRDASPHNIFVTYDGQTKLVDFGIAKASMRSAETCAGVVKGKVPYMAPEQANCEAVVDRRADIFAVGTLLFEIITGARIWRGLSDLHILERLVNGKIPRPRDVRPDVPPDLDAICARALAASPADRYPTAAALRHDLLNYLCDNGHHIHAEDVGSIISEVFRDRKTEIQSIIERQLCRLTMSASGEGPISTSRGMLELPRLASLAPPSTPEPSVPPSFARPLLPPPLPETPLSPLPANLSLPTLPALPALPASLTSSTSSTSSPPADDGKGSGSGRVSVDAGLSASSLAPIGPGSAPPGSPSHHPPATSGLRAARRRAPVTTGLFALLTVGLGAVVMARGRAPLPMETSSASASSGRSAPILAALPLPPPVPMVELQIKVTTPGAAVYFDGAVLSMPFVARFPADGSGHLLRVAAPGFVSQSRMIVFNKDISLEIALDPLKLDPGPKANGASTAEPAPDVPPDGPVRPAKQQLESGDPWAP